MSAVMDDTARRSPEAAERVVIPIITPTIPGREELLGEAMTAVQKQTHPVRHHVYLDGVGVGPALARMRVLEALDDEWVAFLDDDDLIDPDHIETLVTATQWWDCDLVFSWYRRVGSAPVTPRVEAFDEVAEAIMQSGRNIIPVTCLVRTEALWDAGGFDQNDRYEDYALWMRMLAAGSTFTCVPRETWTYRGLGGNRTWT